VKEPNMFHNYETEKMTCKASDAAENLQLYRGVQFLRPRSSCMTHIISFSERPPIMHHAWWSRVEEVNNSI